MTRNKVSSRILSLLLVFLMVFSMFPTSAFADTGNNGDNQDQNVGGLTGSTNMKPDEAFFGYRMSPNSY